MKKRVLQFEGSSESPSRFRYLFSATLNGPILPLSSDGPPPSRSWEEQRADGRIMRAFKAISHDELLGAGTPQELRIRKLNPAGGIITLTPSDFDKLVRWWGRIQWGMYDIDEIDDCYEWLMAAPEERGVEE